MRPDILFSLFTDVSLLPGVGPAVKNHLRRLLGADELGRLPIRDALFHLPCSIIDRRSSPPLRQAESGSVITLTVKVGRHFPSQGRYSRRSPYKVLCHAPDGDLTLVFFHGKPDYVKSSLPEGEERVISGTLERYHDALQMTHPDYIVPLRDLEKVKIVEPVYPLTGGISNKLLRKIIAGAQAKVKPLPEWADEALVKREGWPGWITALTQAHAPKGLGDLAPAAPARARLAYDELLAGQLALALIRRSARRQKVTPMPPAGPMRAELLQALPFSLTQGQQQVLAEIDADLGSGTRMLRLLQGDVGSGKTLVALLAMLRAGEAGGQAALMVPTELLARQHAASIGRMLAAAGSSLKPLLLTGALKGREREQALAAIASGEAKLVIGTHALFQGGVGFGNLTLAIIDEQHRFGVRQRMALTRKSPATHLLAMTATPIPRTLVMASYGDMESSQLTEKPAGRKEIATRAIPLSREAEVLEAIGRTLARGEKIYWICPLVEESEEEETEQDIAAAHARHIEFTARFGPRVGLAHGRQKQQEREQAMQGFAGDMYDMLVATTVVEVGVDVPEATVIVIEHAERFGLSQLHQLRGRVGRGDKPSTCLLLYKDASGQTAQARIRVLRETNDGFRIAEEDLKLRGGGDVLGTRQSGLPEFRLAVGQEDGRLLACAHDDARLALERDPQLRSPRGEALRSLLYLFGQDENLRLVDAG